MLQVKALVFVKNMRYWTFLRTLFNNNNKTVVVMGILPTTNGKIVIYYRIKLPRTILKRK